MANMSRSDTVRWAKEMLLDGMDAVIVKHLDSCDQKDKDEEDELIEQRNRIGRLYRLPERDYSSYIEQRDKLRDSLE